MKLPAIKAFPSLMVNGLCLSFLPQIHAAIIFQDDFSGSGATNLNGLAPDIGTESWVADTGWKADGSTSTQSSATLAFTPLDDVTYTLEASFANLSATNNWIGVGFANGQSAISGTNSRFTAGTVSGRGWTLFRNAEGARNTFIGNNTGTGQLWDGLTGDLGNAIDVRMILSDTIVGAGVNWQITYFAKLPASATYTQIRTAIGDVGDDITSVGFTNNGTPGDLTFFQISDNTVVPEPGSLALLGLANGLMMARRRRNS